jgi:hypothetical protein
MTDVILTLFAIEQFYVRATGESILKWRSDDWQVQFDGGAHPRSASCRNSI